MSRRLKFITPQMGDVFVYCIWEKDGQWEGEWDTLRGTVVGDLFSKVTQIALDAALTGYHKPLVDQLGIPPVGALRKMPSFECAIRSKCPFYDTTNCLLTAPKMPWCFEPDGIEDPAVRLAAQQAIEHWRQAVYVTVITP